MNVGSLRRSRSTPSKEALSEIRGVVAVRTSGLRQGGLRCNFDRLSEDDQRRAVELVKEADYQTWSWQRLGDRKRKELERLIEKAADAPGIFKDTRAMEEIQRLASEAHVAAVRRPTTRKQENTFFAELGRCIEQGFLDASHVAILVLIQVALSSGQTLGPRSWIETLDDSGETALVVNRQYGLFAEKFDPHGELGPRWMTTLDHLAVNEWFDVQKLGNEWRISRGARLRAAMAGKPIRDEVVVAR